MSKTIKTSRGKEIIVDASDFDWISSFRWHIDNKGYAITNVSLGGSDQAQVKIHRMVMGLSNGDPKIVDHINGNKLDNRRCNLRVCTKSQNVWNQGPQKTNTTGYKGVSKNTRGRFVAQIGCHGRKYHLGSFDTAQEAYEVYCLAADLLHGEFANHGRQS
ncbi:HNH endonuclease [Burkholderia sp. 572]|uniref:HNH endonuclease n=1 Tax=Burkholderia sp. 572 TaxID=3156414 RepID=UPI00339903C1